MNNENRSLKEDRAEESVFILPSFASARSPWSLYNKTVLVKKETFGAILFWKNNALEIVMFDDVCGLSWIAVL